MLMITFLFSGVLEVSENTNLHTLMGQLNQNLHFLKKKHKLQLLVLDPAQKPIQLLFFHHISTEWIQHGKHLKL